MYMLTVREHFDAAHHLQGHAGRCARVHGHRWVVEVEVAGECLDGVGMMRDFSELQATLRTILPDHMDINEVYTDLNPTAENLARVFFEQMKARVPETLAVTVWETPDCGCRYEPSVGASACCGGCRC
jgi:6-pyruvoyltetrahydropterin/6-carboxytetrahydropterin synthase